MTVHITIVLCDGSQFVFFFAKMNYLYFPLVLLIIFLRISSDEDRFLYEPLPPVSEFRSDSESGSWYDQRYRTREHARPESESPTKKTQDRSRHKGGKISKKSSKETSKKSKSIRKSAGLMSKIDEFSASYRQCLLDHLRSSDTNPWKLISSGVKSCFSLDIWKALKIRRIKESQWKEGYKFIILPTPITSPCIAVLAPKGLKDISAAEELHGLLPECKLIGVNEEENHEGFQRLGTYYGNKIVGPADGGVPTKIEFVGGFEGITTELPENMVTVKTFLEDYVRQSQIDYLWLDGCLTIDFPDGQFTPKTWNFDYPQYLVFTDPIDVTICQISVSTRKSESKDNRQQIRNSKLFKDMIVSITTNSPFLPIRSKFSKKSGYLRQLYVNMANPECAKKFLAPAFLGNQE